MIPRFDTRMYTNILLTVIAILLSAFAFQAFKINVIGSAHAQDDQSNINRSVPQTQDIAVANATMQVAAANQEIAKSLLEVARAIQDAGNTIAGSSHSSSSSNQSSSTPSSSSTPRSTERPSIEIEAK